MDQVFYFRLCIAMNLLSLTHSEYFTSSAHLTALLKFELQLFGKLKSMVRQQESRLAILRRFYQRAQNFTGLDYANEINSIRHPVTAFKTVRRCSYEWPYLKKKLVHSSNLTMLAENKLKLPTEIDVTGAKYGLLRLQNTFRLPAKQIVDGIIQEASARTKLAADDAYDIGLAAYDRRAFSLSVDWMYESLRLLKIGRYSGDDKQEFNSTILHQLSWSECKSKDEGAAYLCVLKRSQPFFNRTGLQAKKRTKTKFDYTMHQYPSLDHLIRKNRKEKLCRGKKDEIPAKYRHKMVCWFKSDHPLLVIKPAKFERIFCEPEIIIFREAITEIEMAEIKEASTTKLERARTRNTFTGMGETVDYRVSKSAWLMESELAVVEKVYTKIEAYTGLDMKAAEPMQIANYGIGGHYDTHFDFYGEYQHYTSKIRLSNKENTRRPGNKFSGERIATVLIYMSDVQVGGTTVFSYIGQAVEPVKGDAIFWYNLNHDGTGDHRTSHAACPVLIGEKWVSTVWIHEHGQEFRKKCKLHYDDE